MFLTANFVEALAQVLSYLLEFYKWAIIVNAFISWVNPDPYNFIVQFLQKATEPILYPIRRAIGSYWIGIDLSPMIALLSILFLQNFLIRSLFQWAGQLR
ncbi:MAG: YggT family protein [Nitrospirae bacterium]|nr:YggT family protein [Candidatus Troglogloeales bacterium]MBI3598972.1 YggT family protein [Candidatus Troglogloeales bacterium]